MASQLGVTPLEFRLHLWRQKLESLGYRRRCLRDPMFSRFGTIPGCDGQTARQTERHTRQHILASRRAVITVILQINSVHRVRNGTAEWGFKKIVHFVTTFFKLCMVLGMDMTFSKTTAHKSRETPGGRYAQNPRWPPLKTERAITLLIFRAEPIVIPLF